MRRLTRGSSNTPLGRPVSKLIAPTLAIAAEVNLVATPLPNGDSWIGRVVDGIDGMKNGYSLQSSWIGTDGQNAASVFAQQVFANSGQSILMAAESVALAAAGRFFGA